MNYFTFPNTGGKMLIWDTVAPGASDTIGGRVIEPGSLFFNETTKALIPFNGTDFTSEGETSTGVYKWSYDSTDYVTLTITNAGTATFDHVSGGTAEYIFSDKVSAKSPFKVYFDALAYMTITQADGGAVTFDSVSDGTAGFTFSDPVILNAAAGSHLQLGGTATAALAIGGGTAATALTTAAADKNFGGFWTQSTAVSGDSRGLYWRHYLGGVIAATGYGDAIRAFCTVTGTGYSYASGLHGTLQINADATVTGSGSGIRATLSAATATRTLAGALSALHVCSDVATGNTLPTVHGFMRFTDDGAVRMSNLAVVPVPANGTLFAAHITQTMTHSIRIIGEDGTAYYIMCTNAATNRS